MRIRFLGSLAAVCFACVVTGGSAIGAELDKPGSKADSGALSMSLDDYLKSVFERNESIQMRLLEAALEHKRYQGEKWIFEPEFFSTLEALDSQRANTVEQRASLSSGFGLGSTVFNQRNRTMASGVEMLAPTGTRLQLSYSLSELHNNLNSATFGNGEWLSSVGVQLTQPLLKNAWLGVNMAGIRLAALGSDVAYQQYRRGMLEIMSGAEAVYWDLYLAQEQLRIAEESVKLANTILKDAREWVKVGKASELDVLQAEAGQAEREALVNEARQRLRSAANTAMDLMLDPAIGAERRLAASDTPKGGKVVLDDMSEYQRRSLEMNPDYLRLMHERDQNQIRFKVATNQKLPQLDLTGGYSVNGVGKSPGASHRQTQQNDFPVWTVGLQFRMPLAGAKRARRHAEAARLQLESSEKALQGAVVEIGNVIETAVHNVGAARDSIAHYRKVVEFNKKLLETQLARLEVGKTTSRVVFETERDLFEARINLLRGLVAFERSILQLHVITGLGLEKRGLEVGKDDLAFRTSVIIKKGKIDEEAFHRFVEDVTAQYHGRDEDGTKAGEPVEAK